MTSLRELGSIMADDRSLFKAKPKEKAPIKNMDEVKAMEDENVAVEIQEN